MKNLLRFLFILSLSVLLFATCDDKKDSPTEPDIGDVNIGTLDLSQEGILENENSSVTVKVTVPSGIIITDSMLSLIKLDASNNSLGEITKLYDNGDLQNADDIAGDNIFSGIVNIFEQNSGTIKLQATGNAQTEKGVGSGYSNVALLNIYSNVTGDEYSQVTNTEDNAANKFEELLSGSLSNVETAVNETVQWLSSQPGVINVASEGNTAIEIQFSSGLYGALIFSEANNSGTLLTRGGILTDKERRSRKSIPVAKQTIGQTSNKPSSLNKLYGNEALDPDIIGNKNVLIYAPFEAAFAPFNERANIIANLNKSEFKFQITSLVNQEATVSSLNNITRYGLVVLATHGAGGTIFLTGEVADTTLNIWKTSYKALYSSGKIGISSRLTISDNGEVKKKEKVYYIRPGFISGLTGKFPNSVILNNSCEGTKSAGLQTAFLGKGAKVYYGYSKVVNSDFCVTIADSVSKRLAVDLKNTAESYLSWTDPNSPNAKFEYKKSSNDVHYALKLVNGDFEFGNLDGWTIEGDGRNLSKLSYLSPPGGQYMGIISTGLGFTTSTGKIFQSIRVEEDQSSITFKWNFLSEEFLEYINSSFQDFFKVTIIDKDGNEDVLMNKSIDVLAAEFGAKKFNNEPDEVPQPGDLKFVSPDISFDQGDVYMTGWQTYTFDITGYRGKIITIEFSAGDVGDSIFDTAILLDDIEVK